MTLKVIIARGGTRLQNLIGFINVRRTLSDAASCTAPPGMGVVQRGDVGGKNCLDSASCMFRKVSNNLAEDAVLEDADDFLGA